TSTSRSSSFPSFSCWRSFSRLRRRRSCASVSASGGLDVTSPLEETTNRGRLSPTSRLPSPGRDASGGRGEGGPGGNRMAPGRAASGCGPRWRPPSLPPPVPRYSGPAPPRSSWAAALPARGAVPPRAPAPGVAARLRVCVSARPLELQNGDVRVGVHADLGGDLERPLHDVLGELDGRPRQVPRIALELLLELLEQRERIGGRPREAGQDLPALERPHFVGVRLHHRVAERDLAVTAQGDVPVATDTQNRGAANAAHRVGCSLTPADGPDGTPSSAVPPTYEYTPAWC